VLQQIEDFGDPTVTANDCFRPVSRFWDRIARPEQLLASLPRALAVLTDPAECGPVTLALCQDVQAEAYDFPTAFFAPHIWEQRRPRPDRGELAEVAFLLRQAEKPLIVAGGGVLYSGAGESLDRFASRHGIPVAETQAGKGALPWDHPLNLGSIGVTGSSAANALAAEADLILAVGTRLQDFTTGSRALFRNPARRLVQVNVTAFDAHKHGAVPLIGDARESLEALTAEIAGYVSPAGWRDLAKVEAAEWTASADAAMAPQNTGLPSDAQVIGAVNRTLGHDAVLVCAAGGLPGELHKLWRSAGANGYHLEYGYSCMGYEIAGGLGVKMALPNRDVVVMVGDGSYLMMNSEIATSVMLGRKLVIVVLDNRGFGCINRLQRACGGESFNNLLQHAAHEVLPQIDFRQHAESLGAAAEKVESIAELETALGRAKQADRTYVVVIDTDPLVTTQAGGAWWDVAVPEVSKRPQVAAAHAAYVEARAKQRLGS
jgi:3D-(3,5/4)-trihydroxycyclohexane-1,2-dione acylhydrolase (decyclizing)